MKPSPNTPRSDKPPFSSAGQGAGEVPRRLGGRLGQMSLRRQVVSLAMWPLLEFALGSLVSIVDTWVGARVSESASGNTPILAALSVGAYVAWLLFILQGAVGTGANALIARAIGARDVNLAKRALGQALVLGLSAGLVSCVGLLLGADFLIRFVGLEGEAAAYAAVYFRILALSAPMTGIMVAVNAGLRGAGDTRTPFLVTVAVNLVNVGASLFFVFELGWGVAGIAWGTVLGWATGMLLALTTVGSRRLVLRRRAALGVAVPLKWRLMRFDRDIARRILAVGVPSAVEILGMWSINFIGLKFITHLGESALSAHGVTVRLESLSYLPGFALGVAAQTLAGQYLGARNPDLASKAVREAWKLGVLFMSSVGVIFFCIPDLLVALLARENTEVLNLATPLIRLCAFTQPFFATCMVLKMSMRGAGASGLVMRWSFASMLVFRILVLYLAIYYFEVSLFGAWMVIACDLVSQSILFSRLHFTDQWKLAKL